jgi:cell division protein FtsN
VKKKAIPVSGSETGSKATTPTGSLGIKEESIPEGKINPMVGQKIGAVGPGSAKDSAAQSDQDPMPPTEVVETTRAAPIALEFSHGQVEAKAIESKLQLEKKEEKTPGLRSLVGVPKEKEQNEMRPEMTGSQRPAAMEAARPNKASQPDLGIHAVPALGATEVPSSSATTSKPASEVERLGDIASLTKINPKPARPEKTPAPITASEPQSGEAETVEEQAIPVHGKHMENLPEIKPLMKPMPKALEGYIIQVAFKDRSEARSWADTFEQRGYAVSMTEASAGESLRVRVGNFRLRDQAERQLKSIRDNGLIGIILNLPQAYRPEVRSSLP